MLRRIATRARRGKLEKIGRIVSEKTEYVSLGGTYNLLGEEKKKGFRGSSI
jgi:hypothetical protein